jgi:predicted RNase H-like HicB family nuclease
MKNYIALVETGDKDTAYGVVFPDLPGCYSAGDTFERAIKNAHEALAFHISGLKEDGVGIPEPRSLKQIKAEWEDWHDWKKNYDFVITNIALLPPYGTEKILVSMDASLIARIDRVSKNRSAFLAAAAERFLDNEPMSKQA